MQGFSEGSSQVHAYEDEGNFRMNYTVPQSSLVYSNYLNYDRIYRHFKPSQDLIQGKYYNWNSQTWDHSTALEQEPLPHLSSFGQAAQEERKANELLGISQRLENHAMHTNLFF